MPDEDVSSPEGPREAGGVRQKIDVHTSLRQLGPSGVKAMYQGGWAIVSVCLFHGVHRAVVGWTQTVDWGKRIVWLNPVLRVRCDKDDCGAYLDWRRESEWLTECRCGLD